ncbi:MAG: CsgG/HfaB family protein [bacterium]|nr:CsgG/HfaB family protein [bacterium]
MKNVKYLGAVFAVAIISVFLVAAGCDPTANVQRTSVSTPIPSGAPANIGPKATISMAPMEGLNLVPVKWGGVGVGPAINEVFESAIMATGRFRLVNRGAQLKSAISEQDLATAGRVRKDTAVKTGEITGSDLIVKAKITGFDPGDSGVGGALGIIGRAIGGWWGAAAGIAGGIKTSRLVVDIHVVDARTTETVLSTTVEGNSVDWSAGVGVGGFSLGAAIGGWKDTPLEKSLRVVVEKAAGEISTKLPAEYFKH